MFIPSISNMTPDEILRKRPFTRLLPPGDIPAGGSAYMQGDLSSGYAERELRYELLSQGDFLMELDQNSHKIMSDTYYPDPVTYDAKKKQYFKRKVARVTVNLPEIFANQRTSMLTGSDTDLKLMVGGQSEKMQDLLSLYSEGWAYKNMEVAKYELVYNNGIVGDAAILFYLNGGEVGWTALSYKNGDILYPHYDPYGKIALFGRKYRREEKGKMKTYLDVYDNTFHVRYREATEDDRKTGRTGWVVDSEPTPHRFPRVPVAYVRYGEPFFAGAMNDVNNIELALSQLCENNKHYALRILTAFGADLQVQATLDGRPTQINSPDPNARVGYLEPADSSGSFELQLRTLIKNAYQAAHCVESPELKSGSDVSSLTVQMLYADVYHKSLNDAKVFQAGLDDIVELFRHGWAIETGKLSEFDPAKFRVKGTMHPYIMKSENEEVNNIAILSNSGGLPRKAVANESYKLGYGTPRNYEDLLQEEHDALTGEAAAPATTPQGTTVNESRNQG